MENHLDKLNIGIVGGGEAASKAIAVIKNLPFINIEKIVCQPSELVGEVEIGKKLTEISELLTNSKIEVIYIATPNNTHLQLALAGIQAKKHILIEKPLATLDEDFSWITNYQSPNQTIAVAFKKRFNHGIQRFFKMGKDLEINSNITCTWYMERPNSGWRFDPGKSGGGVVIDLGSHIFDMLEFNFGRIVCIEAKVIGARYCGSVEEEASIDLEFESGKSGIVNLSWNKNQRFMEITSNRGSKTIRYTRNARSVDLVYSFSKHEHSPYKFDPNSEYIGLFTELYKEIKLGSSKIPKVADGLRNLDIIDAVYKSVRNGKAVWLERTKQC